LVVLFIRPGKKTEDSRSHVEQHSARKGARKVPEVKKNRRRKWSPEIELFGIDRSNATRATI